MPQGLNFDELHVVSDLHLGGAPGFQIFSASTELAWLADQVAQSTAPGLAALVVNGDFIDFLAETPALAFDPQGAIDKIDRVMGDATFKPVFDAFRRLLAQPRRLLIVNLGNHDLELALPWVRRHLALRLADDEAARSRLLLVTDGTGLAAQVGGARVVCLHGNEVDSWNVTDFERVRRIGRDLQYGHSPEPWTPNAGSQLVVEVMNQVKARYPFVDLLKPETEAVVPILAALNPALLKRLQALVGIGRRKAVDAARMASGFLDADLAATGAGGAPGSAGAAAEPWAAVAPRAPARTAQDLLSRANAAVQAGADPMSLVHGNPGEQLGVLGATWDWLTGKPRDQVLREALEFLDKDQSFDPFAPDDTFKGIDKLVSPDVHLVVTGHTHLERSLRRTVGPGHYFNSGTWASLMRITPEVRQDAQRFAKVFGLLDGSPVARLKAELPDLVLQRQTVVRIVRQADGRTQADLCHVVTQGGATRLDPLAGAGRSFNPGA